MATQHILDVASKFFKMNNISINNNKTVVILINCRVVASFLSAIALAFECVPSLSSVYLFSNSQAALDMCEAELLLLAPDFQNKCWVKCRHIAGIICKRNLNVGWYKIKKHSGVLGNV
ncbi:hypothetical protein G9A89_010563 [Geosiphon pyriformis]|nr:hypothetical protein G9A89_010563 [Geosiphon pyriformis]